MVPKYRMQIELEREWLALYGFQKALQVIVERAEAQPWSFTGQDAADLARRMLVAFEDID